MQNFQIVKKNNGKIIVHEGKVYRSDGRGRKGSTTQYFKCRNDQCIGRGKIKDGTFTVTVIFVKS